MGSSVAVGSSSLWELVSRFYSLSVSPFFNSVFFFLRSSLLMCRKRFLLREDEPEGDVSDTVRRVAIATFRSETSPLISRLLPGLFLLNLSFNREVDRNSNKVCQVSFLFPTEVSLSPISVELRVSERAHQSWSLRGFPSFSLFPLSTVLVSAFSRCGWLGSLRCSKRWRSPFSFFLQPPFLSSFLPFLLLSFAMSTFRRPIPLVAVPSRR